MSFFRSIAVTIAVTLPGLGAAQLSPITPGIAAATCYSGPGANLEVNPDGYVFGLMDLRDMEGRNWTTGWSNGLQTNDGSIPAIAMDHLENAAPGNVDQWKASTLGQVFGLALDDHIAPYPYVTTTSIYGCGKQSGCGSSFPFTTAGLYADVGGSPVFGAVWRLDPSENLPGGVAYQLFANLPNNGVGLGQIAYRPGAAAGEGQFYVSNFEDGNIYVLPNQPPAAGLQTNWQVFDHGAGMTPPVLDDPMHIDPARLAFTGGNSGLTQRARRIWAVQYEPATDRLYYAVWKSDFYLLRETTGPMPQNEVWSVALDSAGVPDAATAQQEFLVPHSQASWEPAYAFGRDFSAGPSDMAIAQDGLTLILAERGDAIGYASNGGVQALPHNSRVLRFVRASISAPWALSSANAGVQTGRTGANATFAKHNNSAGGVSFAPGYSPLMPTQRPDDVIAGSVDQWLWRTMNDPKGRAKAYGAEGSAVPVPNAGGTAMAQRYQIDYDGVAADTAKNLIGDIEVMQQPLPFNADDDGLCGCCPPWDSETLISMMHVVPSGTLLDPYHLEFRPDPAWLGAMQAYTDWVNYTDPSHQRLCLSIEVYDHGTDPVQPGTAPDFLGNSAAPRRYLCWDAGGTSVSGGGFWSLSDGALLPDVYYKVNSVIGWDGSAPDGSSAKHNLECVGGHHFKTIRQNILP